MNFEGEKSYSETQNMYKHLGIIPLSHDLVRLDQLIYSRQIHSIGHLDFKKLQSSTLPTGLGVLGGINEDLLRLTNACYHC